MNPKPAATAVVSVAVGLVGSLIGALMRRRIKPHEHEAIPGHRPLTCWCWEPME